MFFHHPISGTAWILQPSDPRTVVLGQIGQLDRANAARKVLAVGNQDVECPGGEVAGPGRIHFIQELNHHSTFLRRGVSRPELAEIVNPPNALRSGMDRHKR